MAYKIVEFDGVYSINIGNKSIPRSSDNLDYQQFIKDIALGNNTVEGPDVREPSYVELRQAAYPTMAEQLDMQYWDGVNGTSTWADAIQAVKDQYPTTITGGVTVGDVPAWVQEEADAWLFEQQLEDYTKAMKRLSQYRLADGREEVTEEIVIEQHNVLDENGDIMFDDDHNEVMEDVTETIVKVSAIEALPATVIETEFNFETGEEVETEVPNPLIVKDDEERAEAQAVVDSTPQAVIDAYNA